MIPGVALNLETLVLDGGPWLALLLVIDCARMTCGVEVGGLGLGQPRTLPCGSYCYIYC